MGNVATAIEKLPELVNSNAALVRRGRWFTATWMVELGEQQYRVQTEAGRIATVTAVRTHLQPWVFAVRAGEDVWQRFWHPMPEPGFHDIIALMRYGRMRLEGNLEPLIANLLYLKQVLESPRQLSR
jgi:hypothetical protein